MTDLDYLAIGAAAVAAFVASAAWYVAFGKQLAAQSEVYADAQMSPVDMVLELLRNLVLAAAVAWLVEGLDVDGAAVVGLALVLWVGFPAVLWSGSILHEKYSWQLAAIHAGDWLVKLLVITAVVAAMT